MRWLFIVCFLLASFSLEATKGRATLVPPPSKVHRSAKVIVIDAGHGGKDFGTHNEGFGYEEKELTLKTAHMVRHYLENLGYRVIMTRKQDLFVPLEKRAEIANGEHGDLFVSIHYNFSPSRTAEGVEVYYHQGFELKAARSKELAQEVLKRVVKHTGAHSRGVKTANFVVIRQTQMPSVLVEGGFLSNPEERSRIKDPRYLHFLACGIARGIDAYLSRIGS